MSGPSPPASRREPVIVRVAAGVAVATVIALLARGAGALTSSGAVAATAVGSAAAAAGWRWAALLVAYFTVASLASRFGAARKEARTADVVEKGGRRDAAQVLANGAVFASLAVVVGARGGGPVLAAAAAGALAASAADTFATEVGTLGSSSPRSLLSWRRVPPGTSGAVSAAGSAASVGGAAVVALACAALELGPSAAVVVAAGTVGALVDSLIGATAQERRWCPSCMSATERRVHSCGSVTVRTGGVAWLRNDAVNLAATLAGAAVAAVLATL